MNVIWVKQIIINYLITILIIKTNKCARAISFIEKFKKEYSRSVSLRNLMKFSISFLIKFDGHSL